MVPARLDLSIIIVNWNTRELLRQCLASIENHPSQASCEVWVVDNASNDGSVQMVQECFPKIKLIANSTNGGFSRANNQAIAESTGRYVLLLNSDTVVRPGALDSLVQFLEHTPQAAAAGAQTFNSDGTLQVSCYPAPTLSRELWFLFHLDRLRPYGSYDMSTWDPTTPREVDAVLGACLMIRRDVLNQTGLLDEGYFMYSEEIDLCYRIRQAGWRIYWVPASQIVHFGGQSTKQVAPAMFLHLYRSKVRYFRKHYGRSVGLIYKLILSVASVFRLALSPLAWLEGSSRRRQHLILTQDYWNLLRALSSM